MSVRCSHSYHLAWSPTLGGRRSRADAPRRTVPLGDFHRSEMKGGLWQQEIRDCARVSDGVLLWCLLGIFQGVDRGGGEASLGVASGDCAGGGGVAGDDEVEDLVMLVEVDGAGFLTGG